MIASAPPATPARPTMARTARTKTSNIEASTSMLASYPRLACLNPDSAAIGWDSR